VRHDHQVVEAASVIYRDPLGDLATSLELAAEQRLLADQIRDTLLTLTPRERRVIERRFGLTDDTDETLTSIGREIGVTRERIRQIEAKALRKLRHPSRSRKLKDYLE